MTCRSGRRRLRDRPRGAPRAGGSREDSPWEPREGTGPGRHPDFRLWLPEPWQVKSGCSSSPGTLTQQQRWAPGHTKPPAQPHQTRVPHPVASSSPPAPPDSSLEAPHPAGCAEGNRELRGAPSVSTPFPGAAWPWTQPSHPVWPVACPPTLLAMPGQARSSAFVSGHVSPMGEAMRCVICGGPWAWPTP